MTPFRTVLLLVVALLALVEAPVVAHQPPTDLHLEGDHWTAWNPPPIPPEGVEVYIIQTGDTLWDLAEQFHGDPYLWPQIWERNQYILDAHWIYPGDPLVMGLQVKTADEVADMAMMADDSAGDEMAAMEPPKLWDSASQEAPTPLGSEDDIHCTGYIGDPDEQFAYRVVGSEYSNLSPTASDRGVLDPQGSYGTQYSAKLGLTPGDIVYLDGGQQAGMIPGSVLVAIQPKEVVESIDGERVLGRYYSYLGRVRVLSVQADTGIGEVVYSCDPITLGSYLKIFEPEPIPLGRPSGMRGYNVQISSESLSDAPALIRSERGELNLGKDTLVYIDQGSNDDWAPGDLFNIYRVAEGLPAMVIGEAALLSVQENSALARILAWPVQG
jgi:hypothetical protein